MSPGVPHMEYTYPNLFDSPELLQILMTFTTVIKSLLPNFLGRDIVTLNWVKLASCKSALNSPVVYSTDRSKALVPVLVLLFVALWLILRGDLLYGFPSVILCL